MPPKNEGTRGGSRDPGSPLEPVVQRHDVQHVEVLTQYSWIRFTWMSNSQSGFSSTPLVARTRSASRALLARLTARQRVWNAGSPANGSSLRSSVSA